MSSPMSGKDICLFMRNMDQEKLVGPCKSFLLAVFSFCPPLSTSCLKFPAQEVPLPRKVSSLPFPMFSLVKLGRKSFENDALQQNDLGFSRETFLLVVLSLEEV